MVTTHAWLGLLFIVVLLLLRLLACVARARAWRSSSGTARQQPARTMVVLGSGGHTAEMLTLLAGFNRAHYAPLVYVAARSDANSLQRVAQFESSRASSSIRQLDEGAATAVIVTVPRSRAVAQSWLTTPFTTLYALLVSFLVVWRHRPEVVRSMPQVEES